MGSSQNHKTTERRPTSPPEAYEKYWRCHAQVPEWDLLSEYVSRSLLAAIKANGMVPEKTDLLEVGSGSGRLSLHLARMGFRVFLLDPAPSSFKIASGFFDDAGEVRRFVLGSGKLMPFASGSLSVVLASGVLCHFPHCEWRGFLGEMRRLIQPGGLVVMLNVYEGAVLWLLGYALNRWIGRWLFGEVFPIQGVKGRQVPDGLVRVSEFPFAFLPLLTNMFARAVPGGRWLTRSLDALLLRAARSPLRRALFSLDRLLSQTFGGYLLVSVFRRA